MYNSLAIWHYPYRTPTENVYYFAERGFNALSQSGLFFASSIMGEERGAFTEAVRKTGIRFTVHHLFPCARKNFTEGTFLKHMREFRRWQDETGLLWNLSFDVPFEHRPGASKYIRMVLDIFRGTDTKISVEDYGIPPEEQADLEVFQGDPQFGLLIDLGHMNLRLRKIGEDSPYGILNQNGEGAPLPPGDGSPEAFRNALLAKHFPIFEFHIHNNSGYDDEHCYVEYGTIDMKGLARVLREMDGESDRVGTLEIVPYWTGTPEEVKNQKAAEQDYWAYLEQHYTLPVFAGKPDPARDARAMKSCAFWRSCIDNA